MGLDMYAHSVDPLAIVSATPEIVLKDGVGDKMKPKEIMYWRKHHDLHGMMEQIYRDKGGTKEFNCIALQLTSEDLDRLEAAIKGEELPHTEGFFFGDNPPDEATKKEDLKFIAKARQELKKGRIVAYYSWW